MDLSDSGALVNVDREVQEVVRALAVRHPVFAEETIRREVVRGFAGYREARVRAYLPLLVQRDVHARLRALDHDFLPERPHRAGVVPV